MRISQSCPANHRARQGRLGVGIDHWRSATATDVTGAAGDAGLAAKGRLRHGPIDTTNKVHVQTVPAKQRELLRNLAVHFSSVVQLLSSRASLTK